MNALCILSAAGGWIGLACLLLSAGLVFSQDPKELEPRWITITATLLLIAGIASFASCSANDRICEARDRAGDQP